MSMKSTQGSVADDSGLKLRMRGEANRISSQHKQLETLFDRVLDSVRNGGARKATGDFHFFETALEAHMSVEESIYFPALHGLRNNLGGELGSLMEDHQKLRMGMERLREMLASNDREGSLAALHDFAADVDHHERVEEELIERITEGPIARLGRTSFED